MSRRLLVIPEYPAIILATPGLVGFWRLGESGGTVARDLAAARNGTYTASPTLGVPGPTTDGDKAMTTNGSTSYCTVPDSAAFSLITTGQLSIECWVNAVGTAAAAIVSKGNAGGNNWEYKVQRGTSAVAAGAAVAFTLWDNAGNNRILLDSGANTVPNGVWTHVAVTVVNGVRATLYVNGRAMATGTTFSFTSVDGASPLDFGRRPNNDQYFAGSIKDVALYSRALGAGEVADHCNAGASR